MKRRAVCRLLLLGALVSVVGACSRHQNPTADGDRELSARIHQLANSFLTTDDDATNASVLSEARAIFERVGIPSQARVGDSAAYAFVLVNMLGQPPPFRGRFYARVREEASRHTLPPDAVAFAEARQRQADVEDRYATQAPSRPELRDQIARLFERDQAVRRREGFDVVKMEEIDRRTADPLAAILNRYGVPTYEMVGVQAARDFITMVQHQPPAFRLAVLPRLQDNVNKGQADPGTFAMVSDRTRRDEGKPQVYGEQLECSTGKQLEVAPIENDKDVNMRRAELGLMRLELYADLVRRNSPDVCASRAQH